MAQIESGPNSKNFKNNEKLLFASNALSEHVERVEKGENIPLDSFTFFEAEIVKMGVEQKEVEALIEAVVGYLNTPTIIDNFENHQDRREWRKTLDRAELDLIDQNKLRINVINSVFARIDFIDYMHSEKSSDLTSLLKQIDMLKMSLPFDILSEYDTKSLTEKIEYRDAFERVAKHVIRILVEHKLIALHK